MRAVRRDHLRTGQRLRLAGVAALFWGVEVDGAPAVHDLVESRCLGSAARGGCAPAGRCRPRRCLPCRAELRARAGREGGEHTSPSPVDRGKPGSKMHVLSDANGLPLILGLSTANVHDSRELKPMVEGHRTRHDPYRGRYFKPQRLHADKAYDIPQLRRWLWGKRIGVHRPQGCRVQRTVRAPQMGDRTDDVVADGLPQNQPPLRAPNRRLPGLSRPRRSPLLLQTAPRTHHVGHHLSGVRISV
ncbi:Transposase DDE domain-containing protein [Streptomyces sp. ok210]|nr:Transposase DDE domain-containing protein [Streptomyces sp. ok210]